MKASRLKALDPTASRDDRSDTDGILTPHSVAVLAIGLLCAVAMGRTPAIRYCQPGVVSNDPSKWNTCREQLTSFSRFKGTTLDLGKML